MNRGPAESLYRAIDQPSFPDALCVDYPDLPWVAPDDDPQRALESMRRICRACSHIEACRLFALVNPSILGVWGATTTAERQALRRRGLAAIG